MGKKPGRITTYVIVSAVLCGLAWPGFFSPFLLVFSFFPALLAFSVMLPGRSFWFGCLHGAIMYGIGGYWVVLSIHEVFNVPVMVSIPVFLVLLVLFYALPSGVFAALFSVAWNRRGYRIPFLVLCLLLWPLLEFVRGVVFPGFNIMTLASAFYRFPEVLAPVAFLGEHLYSGVVLLVNLSLLGLAGGLQVAGGVKRAEWKYLRPVVLPVLLLAGVVGMHVIPGMMREHPGGLHVSPGSILIVQPRIPAAQKWEKEYIEANLNRCMKTTADGLDPSTKIAIWPETALQFYPQQNSRYSRQLQEFCEKHSLQLVTGGPEFERSEEGIRYYNSIFLVTGESIRSLYRKERLVPFAEYCPMQIMRPLFEKLAGQNQYTPGTGNSGFDTAGLSLRFGICFESLFPCLMARKAENGDLLVVLSDDIWLGTRHGALQHLAGTVLRTVENQTCILFCVNSGISAVIAPDGTISNSLPFGKSGNIPFQVRREN